MHRLILLSAAYRTARRCRRTRRRRDPDNRLLGRRAAAGSRPRRSATALAVGGGWTRRGRQAVRAGNAASVTDTASGRRLVEYERPPHGVPAGRPQRVHGVSGLFDFADPNGVHGRAVRDDGAPQMLFLLNSPFVLAADEALAGRLLAEGGLDDAGRVDATLALGRPPAAGEEAGAMEYLAGLRAVDRDRSRPTPRAVESWRGKVFVSARVSQRVSLIE